MAGFDVIIAGGGPAGCAAAVALSQHVPGLQICLIDAGRGHAVRGGDTVPPTIVPILRHLGLWTSFLGDGHRADYRSISAWGQPHLASNEYLFLGTGPAWQLDRAAFDRSMLSLASARVACVKIGVVAWCRQTGEGVALGLTRGDVLSARYAIDATGRSAALFRMLEAPGVRHDRLVGCIACTRGDSCDRNELLVESVPSGWWYSVRLPGGRRITACMTDADHVRVLGLASERGYRVLLGATRHIRAEHAPDAPLDGPYIQAAGSRVAATRPDLPLLPAGDAALAVDPVCGQGIFNALRSGIFAAYAVGDWVNSGDEQGLLRYRGWIGATYSAYRTTLCDVYAAEARWPEHPFWRRRHETGATTTTEANAT